MSSVQCVVWAGGSEWRGREYLEYLLHTTYHLPRRCVSILTVTMLRNAISSAKPAFAASLARRALSTQAGGWRFPVDASTKAAPKTAEVKGSEKEWNSLTHTAADFRKSMPEEVGSLCCCCCC